MSINLDTYTNLATYALLTVAGGLTSSALTTLSGTGLVYWPAASTPANVTGLSLGPLNASAAITELGNLKTAINSQTVTTTISSVTGPYTMTPGRYNSASTISFSGALTLNAGGDPSAQFFITAGTSITFNSGSSITLTNGASQKNVFWLAGSSIIFSGTLPPNIYGIFIGTTLINFAAAANIYGRVYSNNAISFGGISSLDGDLPDTTVCYAKGTLILTNKGFVPVEDMRKGDVALAAGTITTKKAKRLAKQVKREVRPSAVRRVIHFTVTDMTAKSRPICITKDALGKNCPFQDLYVSPNHAVLVDGELVCAKKLVNGGTIYQDTECESVTYYHLDCARHSVLVANGAFAESYLDMAKVKEEEKFEHKFVPLKMSLPR